MPMAWTLRQKTKSNAETTNLVVHLAGQDTELLPSRVVNSARNASCGSSARESLVNVTISELQSAVA